MGGTKLTRLQLENFTAFRALDVTFAPGVNVLIGTNGTGKTHALKLLYDACRITVTGDPLPLKLQRDFMPHNDRFGRLARRTRGSSRARVAVWRGDLMLRLSFSQNLVNWAKAEVTHRAAWASQQVKAVYVPVKEILGHAPGFQSMYREHHIAFEEVYADLISLALLPRRRGTVPEPRQHLLDQLQEAIQGSVVTDEETFFLENDEGRLEFSLLAEGMRKLGLLSRLIANNVLIDGTALFWDEPEANVHPQAAMTLVDILFDLARDGTQVFVATHSYEVLKRFELRARRDQQPVRLISLTRDGGDVACSCSDLREGMPPNPILEVGVRLYEQDAELALGAQ